MNDTSAFQGSAEARERGMDTLRVLTRRSDENVHVAGCTRNAMERDRERADEQELYAFVRKLHKEVAKVFVEPTERHRRPVVSLRYGTSGSGFSTGRM